MQEDKYKREIAQNWQRFNSLISCFLLKSIFFCIWILVQYGLSLLFKIMPLAGIDAMIGYLLQLTFSCGILIPEFAHLIQNAIISYGIIRDELVNNRRKDKD